MWGREMRAALLFVLVSLLVGAGLREWRRSNETRFQDIVASLEAGEGGARPSVADAPGPPGAAVGRFPERDSRGATGTPAGAGLRPGSLDPDRATAAEWERLPGIGPSLAARIVGDRATHGPFGGPDGLLRVRGIGPRTLERIRPYLSDPGPDTLRSPPAN